MADPADEALPAAQLSRELASARRQASEAGERGRRSAVRVIEVEQILADSQAQTFALTEALSAREDEARELRLRLDRADAVMTAMKASLSWRITGPLRALKRRR